MTQNTPEKNDCCEKCWQNDIDAIPSRTGYFDDMMRCIDENCECHPKPPTNSPDDVIEGIVKEFQSKVRILKPPHYDFLPISEKILFKQHNTKMNYLSEWLRTTLHSYGENIREDRDKMAAQFGKDRFEEGKREVLAQLEERFSESFGLKPTGTLFRYKEIMDIIKELKENV